MVIRYKFKCLKAMGVFLDNLKYFYNCRQMMKCRLNQQIGYENNFRGSKKILNHPEPAIQGEL